MGKRVYSDDQKRRAMKWRRWGWSLAQIADEFRKESPETVPSIATISQWCNLHDPGAAAIIAKNPNLVKPDLLRFAY